MNEPLGPTRDHALTIHIKNLRALRLVSWTPALVSVLIGANGAGKTTLLQALRLMRVAHDRGLSEAVTTVLGGAQNIESWGAPEGDRVEIGLGIEGLSWKIALHARAGAVDVAAETFTEEGREIFSRDALGGFSYAGQRIESTPQLGLRALVDRGAHEPAIQRMARLVESIAVYYDTDLWTLRTQGSRTTDDRVLNTRGTNAITMLRRWYQDRSQRHRYQFVLDGLKAAFPKGVSDLDFAEAGNTLVARVYHPGSEVPSPLSNEANGFLQLLVLLCQIAGAADGSIVAIDEPENSLHPYAIGRFLDRASQWAKQRNVTVLLATHSTVLLDELNAHPEQVFVMKAAKEGEPLPTRLDVLCDREWMRGFMLGALYEQGEIGSNEDGR